MDYWEFLIQKEGDRSWLPLESSQVEILEGRYRIVARSGRANATVEIRILHQSTEEVPPKRRIQKRSSLTNQDGLMVVFPFTRLQPGTWEIGCCGDLMADLLGNGWRSAIRLQVLSKDSKLVEDWEPDWLPPAEGATPAQQLNSPSLVPANWPAVTQAATPELAVVPLLQIPLEIGLKPPIAPPATLPSSLLHIQLDQEAYTVRWGQSLTFAGHITLPEAEMQDFTQGTELQVCLRDPQTSWVLLDVRQPLALTHSTLPFTCTLEIPLECKSRLLLGEVTVLGRVSGVAALTPLVTESFTVTADLDELLESIANRPTHAELLLAATEPQDASSTWSSYLNLSFLDLVEAPPTRQPFRFQPSENHPIPPQIYRPDPTTTKPKEPRLPRFRIPAAMATPASPVSSAPGETSEAESLAMPLLEPLLEEISIALDESIAAEVIAVVADTQPNELPKPEPIDATTEATTEATTADRAPAPPDAPIAMAGFQALNSKDRFWSRLNALAQDAELSELLKDDNGNSPFTFDDITDGATPSDTATDNSATDNSATDNPFLWDAEGEWAAKEIVVEDDISVQASRFRHAAPVDVPAPLILREDEAVPTPEMEVSMGELVSGKTVTVRVRLPQLVPRIYVKLWISDRQTRTLLDGPRWLVDFFPNGYGDLEVGTQLTVPFGSLEVLFEAIAVEMHTQRESRKTTVSRLVVPPGLPTLVFDDL